MALTSGNEIGLFVRADQVLTYTQIETALTDAGFTDYLIVRTVSGDTTDIQLTVRSEGQPLDAADTLGRLADAIAALGELSTS